MTTHRNVTPNSARNARRRRSQLFCTRLAPSGIGTTILAPVSHTCSAVLLPDPALSTAYGEAFVQRGWGSWGETPFTDLMAITDAAEARPDVDGSKTVAMGGSFGGYMANWIAGHTDRFSAIVTLRPGGALMPRPAR